MPGGQLTRKEAFPAPLYFSLVLGHKCSSRPPDTTHSCTQSPCGSPGRCSARQPRPAAYARPRAPPPGGAASPPSPAECRTAHARRPPPAFRHVSRAPLLSLPPSRGKGRAALAGSALSRDRKQRGLPARLSRCRSRSSPPSECVAAARGRGGAGRSGRAVLRSGVRVGGGRWDPLTAAAVGRGVDLL